MKDKIITENIEPLNDYNEFAEQQESNNKAEDAISQYLKNQELTRIQEEQPETKYMLALFEHPETCAYLLGLEKGILDGDKLLKQNIGTNNIPPELKLSAISGAIFGNKKIGELEMMLNRLKGALKDNEFENITQQIFRNSTGLPFEIVESEFNLFYKYLQHAIQNDTFHIPQLDLN